MCKYADDLQIFYNIGAQRESGWLRFLYAKVSMCDDLAQRRLKVYAATSVG